MIARIRGEHDARWGRWRPTKARETADAPARQTAPVVDRQSGSDAPRRRVLWSSLIGVSVAVGVSHGDLVAFAQPGALPAASDAASVAGCVRGRSDRQPVPSLLRAVRATARSGLRGGTAWKLHELLQADHELLGRRSPRSAGRRHGGARAAPNGAAARLGSRPEPPAQHPGEDANALFFFLAASRTQTSPAASASAPITITVMR